MSKPKLLTDEEFEEIRSRWAARCPDHGLPDCGGDPCGTLKALLLHVEALTKQLVYNVEASMRADRAMIKAAKERDQYKRECDELRNKLLCTTIDLEERTKERDALAKRGVSE